MYPIILERDTPIIDWQAALAWCTTLQTPRNDGWAAVRSDGLLHTDYATLRCRAVTGVITARLATINGVHITGPLPGSEYTPYAVSCIAMAEDDQVRPFLFMAQSPGTITNDAGGDAVTIATMLAIADSPSNDGSSLEKELTVVVKETTSNLPLCFGVGMLGGASSSLSSGGFVRLSIRRLVGVNPAILDTRKL